MTHRILIFALPLLLTACGDGLDHHEETDELGFRTVSATDPATGQLEGEYIVYNPDGSLASRGTYRDGQFDGPRTFYYPDGTPDIVQPYVAGRFDGEYLHYDSLGNLYQRGQYADNRMSGKWLRYYPGGAVEEEVTFADNMEQGPFREWYPDGQPKASGTYLDGDKEHGLLHLYTEAGALERVMDCERARCATIWTPDSSGRAPDGPAMTPPPGATD